MGLFDIFKRRDTDDVQREIERYHQENGTAVPQFRACAVYPYGCDRTAEVEAIITRNFPQYEIRRNVPAAAVLNGVHPRAIPISFLLCENGVPKVAVLLMNVSSHGGVNVQATELACHTLNIHVVRLYHEYENAEAYVVKRINEEFNR